MPGRGKARASGARRKQAAKPRTRMVCNFCAKDAKSVKTLIQGPTSLICNECVAVCNAVLRGSWRRRLCFPGYDQLSEARLLRMLRSSSEAARGALKVQVDALRKRKVGWAAIGKAAGVSRQAARQRFA